MLTKSALVHRFKDKTITGDNNVSRRVCCTVVMCGCLIAAQGVQAAGGCGSAYMPMNALSPDKNPLQGNQYQVGLTVQFARFNQFKEGDDDLVNNGGSKAEITQSLFFVNSAISNKITASVVIPYLRKKQTNNNFGTRVAEGIGDVSLFGRYEVLTPLLNSGAFVTAGMGIKFPTGSLSEPNSATCLPPAFQVGTGSYDILPTASYSQHFTAVDVNANFSAKLPLNENRQGYKFGNEIRLNAAVSRSLHTVVKGMSASVGMGYLYAERDSDADSILPGKLRDGKTVLNTGGSFVDVVPGVSFQLGGGLQLQASVSIPVYEDWNGKRSANVGQVAPEITSLITLVYNGVR
ncbi:MAG: transporter [Ectothiorhodospiraceae bacterium]|nr:transporter [Ectothiorhodospiraceae bacterium]